MPSLLHDNALQGRIAVVTGASSGIGEAVAERLAGLGASVAVLARRADRLAALASRIDDAGGTALAVPTDVRDPGAVRAAAARVADELGTVDLLVSNAGVQHVSPMDASRTDDWQHQVDLNVGGTNATIDAFLPALLQAAEAGRPANLVTVSSIAAVRLLEKFQVYGATKAYIAQLSRALHLELGPRGVRVTTVEPGMVDTELPDHVDDPDATKLMSDLVASGVTLQGEDIAEAIAFVSALPPHVALTEIVALPTGQAI
jgi:NADP-dependent 3-hydroxy acid dehydrogenase YdfG